MPAEEIIQKIQRDAAERAASIIRTAEIQADSLLMAARQEEEEHLRKSREEAEQKAAMEAGHILAIARMEARRMKSEARARAIERCISMARERCRAMPESPAYREILSGLLDQASRELGGGNCDILCHPDDRELLESLVRDKNMAASIECPQDMAIRSGFVMMAQEGRILIDQRLEERLRRIESDLVLEVASILFPEERA